MNEIRKTNKLTLRERGILAVAADILMKLDLEYPSDVLFDSCDQYYVSFKDAAEAFRELASFEH